MNANASMTYDELKACKNSTSKQFYLLKNCRDRLIAASGKTPKELRDLDCDQLVAILDH
jgi:hypothetical protein